MNESKSKASGRGALSEFSEAIGGLFDQVAGLPTRFALSRGYPRHELRVEDDGFRVKAEMPGIKREAIDVSVSGRKLVVSAERPQFEAPDGARVLRRERSSGAIEVTVEIPDDVDPVAVTAKVDDGMLEVWLPKPSERGRKVTVETSETESGKASGETKKTSRKKKKTEDTMPWEEE